MPNPYADNDLVSLELAERLARLGLSLPMTEGCWYMEGPDIEQWQLDQGPFLSISDWLPDPAFDDNQYLIIPSRLDCEAKLVEMGYTEQELYLRRPPYTHYEFYADSIEQDKWVRESADTAAEAVGLALEQAMKEAKDA